MSKRNRIDRHSPIIERLVFLFPGWFAARDLFDELGGTVPIGAIDQVGFAFRLVAVAFVRLGARCLPVCMSPCLHVCLSAVVSRWCWAANDTAIAAGVHCFIAILVLITPFPHITCAEHDP